MKNAGLEEAQAGIKIAGRNINHLRYADNTTLMAEREEELKSILMCTGTTQRDGMGREEGGGFRMGSTCIPVMDSF